MAYKLLPNVGMLAPNVAKLQPNKVIFSIQGISTDTVDLPPEDAIGKRCYIYYIWLSYFQIWLC